MADDKVSHSKTGRGPTRLKNMFKKITKDDKIPLSIDIHTGVPTGQHAKKYRSYLGVLSRERISILTQSWDHVTDHEKNMIWQDILVCNCFYFAQSKVLLYFVFVYELILSNNVDALQHPECGNLESEGSFRCGCQVSSVQIKIDNRLYIWEKERRKSLCKICIH